MKEHFGGGEVFAMQTIPLPFKCDRQLCNAYGQKAKVILYEHDNDSFRKAGQRYSIFHVNLASAEKLQEMHNKVQFGLAKSPLSDRQMNDPFEEGSFFTSKRQRK